MSVRLDHGDDDLDEVHEINVTPFIDVMLVLLIIFMVAAPLATVDIPVDLPTSNAAPQPRPDKPIILTIKSDLSLSVGETTVTRSGLATALDGASSSDRQQRVFLRADKTVGYGDLMSVMNELRAAGYTKIGLMGLEAGAAMMAFIASKLDHGRLLRDDWQTRNWALSATLALVAHGLLAIGLLSRRDEAALTDAGSPVIMLEFAQQATVPAQQPDDLPPGPQQLAPQQEEQAAREEKPQEVVADLNSIAKTQQPEKPEVTLPETTKDPKPDTQPDERAQPAIEATPPPTAAPNAAITADRVAGPAPGDDGARAAKALATWQLALVSHLERFKRYPREARLAEGIANVAFTLDRSGRVVTSRIAKSSGSAVLDAAALDLVRRAQPMPVPPPETAEAQLSQVAPVRYVAVVRK